MAMDNSTANEVYGKTLHVLLCKARLPGKHLAYISSINVFFSITAILGNILILVALHKDSSLHLPSKLLYRCLAITDLFAGLISGPSIALYYAVLDTENRLNLCVYSATIATVSFAILSAVSLLTMAAISVDRLLALSLGLRYRQVVTLCRVRALVIFFWILSIAFTSAAFWKYIIVKSYNYSIILLCIFISTFCYSKIYLTLRHQDQLHQGQPNGGAIPLNIARYRKTVSTAVCVQVTLVACYLPFGIVTAIVTIYGSSPSLNIIWELTSTLVCINSSLNPILYCYKIREVRQEVKNTIRQCLCLAN